jgi:hypothetical protein
MTYWSFILLIIHLWLLVFILICRKTMTKGNIWILALTKLSCLLNSIIFTSATVVSVAYYSVGYEESETWYEEISDLHIHCFNSLIILIDVLILSYPVVLLHYVYIFVFFLVYTFFSLVYWLADPKQNIIYIQIDYNNTVNAFLHLMALFFLSLVIHIFHFTLVSLKMYSSKQKREITNI